MDEIKLSCTEDIGPKDEFILSSTEHMGLYICSCTQRTYSGLRMNSYLAVLGHI